MKVCKVILNILGVLGAIFFSSITFGTLIVLPLVSTISSCLQPENIQKMIFNMNLSKQLLSGFEASAPPELKNLDANFIDELTNSTLVSDIIQLYTDNLLGSLENDRHETITQFQIQELLDKHTPELVSMVRQHLPSSLPVSDEEITKYTFSTLEPMLLTMVDTLPSLKDFGIDDLALTLLHMLYNKTILKYIRNTIILSTLCLFICRISRFKGFLWIGITYLNSTLFLLLSSKFLTFPILSLLPNAAANELSFIVQPFNELLKNHISEYIHTFGIVGIIFTAIYILSRLVLAHKKNNCQNRFAA